jgi:hypothetical protein
MSSDSAAAYATSTMWQEVERPALAMAGTSFARKPFEQAVCRLVEPELSHSDKASLQRAGQALISAGEDDRWSVAIVTARP